MSDYWLVFNGPIETAPCNALRGRIAEILEQDDYGPLVVIFSSEGGNPYEGIALYHYFRSLPRPIQIHAVSMVCSAAVPAFIGGHKRTCEPISRFMTHGLTWGFNSGGQGMPQIVEAASVVSVSQHRILSKEIVGLRTKIPATDLDMLYAEYAVANFIDPKQALDWGIVDDVLELNASGVSQPTIKLWTVGW